MPIKQSINQVAIVGASHGNELTGLYLVKKYQKSPNLIQRSTFKTQTLVANERAVELGRRYVDKDLNRSFSPEDLNNPKLNSYEDLRAKEIKKILVNNQTDFLIDIHSTTANTGIMLILEKGFEQDPLMINLAAYLTQTNSLIKVFSWSKTQAQNRLRNLAKKSIAIEIGAIAHNTLNATYFQQTEIVIQNILDFLDTYNQSLVVNNLSKIEIYKGGKLIDYPRNQCGEIGAMIHPNVKDYQILDPGNPLFISFEGEIINYQSNLSMYPVFVGEASYQIKNIALVLCTKQVISLNNKELATN